MIRLDGATGPDMPPRGWATDVLLTTAVQAAARSVHVPMPYVGPLGEHHFRWGAQTDCHPINGMPRTDDDPVSDQAVAAYVAKYVSKSVGDAGGTDRPVASAEEITWLPVSAHVRSLMAACWRLGRLSELAHLRLCAWTHTLGFRGHALTKSRRYSTTYTALRADRTQHASKGETADGPDVFTKSTWRYVGSGHTSGESLLASGIAEDSKLNRITSRELSEQSRSRP
ncbi:plasmid replication initiator protein [Streptomyces sp. NBC_01285]|nr:plasmid replication initiator protein [Streptomyces sp. NBC_01285]